MKKRKKLIFGVLLAFLLLVVGATSVVAASDTKISENKWVIVEESNEDCEDSYYQITVEKDGYLTISTKNLAKSDYALFLYKKDGNGYTFVKQLGNVSREKSKTEKFAVKKGTYRIRVDAYEGKMKFKYTFTKAKYNKNYCPDNAISLKRNKEVVEVVTPGKFYDRWYKITLDKKKSITYWLGGEDGQVLIYDSDFNQVDIVMDEDGNYSRFKLKKGTYYVCIRYNNINMNPNSGIRCTTFKWK